MNKIHNAVENEAQSAMEARPTKGSLDISPAASKEPLNLATFKYSRSQDTNDNPETTATTGQSTDRHCDTIWEKHSPDNTWLPNTYLMNKAKTGPNSSSTAAYSKANPATLKR